MFQGSDSRVALMSGKVNNVLNATMVIFKRMTSPSDLFPKNPRPKSVSDKEVSLVDVELRLRYKSKVLFPSILVALICLFHISEVFSLAY